MPTTQEKLNTAYNLYEVTVRSIAVEVHDTILVPYMAANDLRFCGKREEYHGFYKNDASTIAWEDVPQDVQDVQDVFDILYWNDMENHFLSDLLPISPMP